jgi:hypothetical protein
MVGASQVPVPLVDAFMKLRFDADLRRRLDLDGETVDPRKQRGECSAQAAVLEPSLCSARGG